MELQYESGFDHAKEIRARRLRIFKRIAVVFTSMMMLLLALGCWIMWGVPKSELYFVDVTIINQTSLPITDSGFHDCTNKIVVPLSPVGAGQSVHCFSRDYNINMCPTGFSYGQAGKTNRVHMGDELFEDDQHFTITITSGAVTTVTSQRGATTQYVQSPSTQPLIYLDQNGKPVPVSH